MARTQALIIHFLVRDRMLIRKVPFQLPVLVLRAHSVARFRHWVTSMVVTLVELANLGALACGLQIINLQPQLLAIDRSGYILSAAIAAIGKGDFFGN